MYNNLQIFQETDAKGSPPLDLEQELIANGDVMLSGREQALTSFSLYEQRYDGMVPFRIGKKVIFPFYCGFVLPKNSVFRKDVNRVIGR